MKYEKSRMLKYTKLKNTIFVLMIATILPSSANFHAVEYNERKVAQGRAELLEMSNFGYHYLSPSIFGRR